MNVVDLVESSEIVLVCIVFYGRLTPRSEHIVFTVQLIQPFICIYPILLSNAMQCMIFPIHKIHFRYDFLVVLLQKHFRMAIFLKIGVCEQDF